VRTTLEASTTKEGTVLLAGLDGPDGIIVIVVVLVLVFGGSAIPKLARNLGSAKTEFEKGLKSAKSKDTSTDTSTDASTPPPSDTPPASTPTDSDSAS
jgi:sec-independent protein translocase protein TatA